MAINEQLTNRLRGLLVNIPHVEEKKMFRGIAFMVNGKMCITVGDNELMCRIDPDLQDKLLENPDCRPMVRDGKVLKGFVYVSDNILKTQKDWDYWVGLCLAFNSQAKASKKRTSKE